MNLPAASVRGIKIEFLNVLEEGSFLRRGVLKAKLRGISPKNHPFIIDSSLFYDNIIKEIGGRTIAKAVEGLSPYKSGAQ